MDWKRLAKRLILADQRISEVEAKILIEEVLSDKTVDRAELEFLGDVRREALVIDPEFDTFFFRLVKRAVLLNGTVADAEARWLRSTFFADRQVSAAERAFLEDVRREATTVGPEFEALCRECLSVPE